VLIDEPEPALLRQMGIWMAIHGREVWVGGSQLNPWRPHTPLSADLLRQNISHPEPMALASTQQAPEHWKKPNCGANKQPYI